MKTCSNCGAMLEDYVAFCTNCGVKVAEPPQPEVKAEAVAVEVPVPESPKVEEAPQVTAPVQDVAQPPLDNPAPPPPPVGTPVYTATPVQSMCPPATPQLNYNRQRANGGMMAWAIALLVISALTGSTITIVMQIIAIIALGDAKVALTQQIYEHKIKVAKTLNIISTVLVSLILIFVITLGSLIGNLFSELLERVYSEEYSDSDIYSYYDDNHNDFYDDIFGY